MHSMRRRDICTSALISALSVLALAAPGAAQASFDDLDASFATNGALISDLGGEDGGESVALDPNGRILAAGSGGLEDPSRPGGTAATLLRLTKSGQLDPSFGGGDGIVKTDGGRYTAQFQSVGTDAHGRVVAVGSASGFDGVGTNLIVARYLDDGTPDPAFGVNGMVTLGGARLWFGIDAIVEGDQVLVLAMTDGDGGMRPTLLRLQEDGTFDDGYGEGGIRRLLNPGLITASAMTSVPGGVIVSGSSAGRMFGATRISSDGTTENDWGRGGYVRIRFSGTSEATAVEVDSRGRTDLAGSCGCPRGISAAVARLSRSGRLDRSFSKDGRRTLRLGGGVTQSAATSLMIGPKNGLLLGVVNTNLGLRRASLVALTQRGDLDRSFSHDGVASPTYRSGLGVSLIADVIADGADRILTAGTLFGANADFVVARFVR